MKIEKQFQILFEKEEKEELEYIKQEYHNSDAIFLDMMIRGGYFTVDILKNLVRILEEFPYKTSNIEWILKQLYKITEHEK